MLIIKTNTIICILSLILIAVMITAFIAIVYGEEYSTITYESTNDVHNNSAGVIENISFNGVSGEAKTLIRLILNAVNDNKETSSHIAVDVPDEFNGTVSDDVYHEVRSFLIIHYGRFDLTDQLFTVQKYLDWFTVKERIMLDRNLLQSCEKDRTRFIAIVDKAISEMDQGSEEEMLNQVSCWIKENYSYASQVGSLTAFFDYGIGNCNAVSMVFRLFAERLNIPCDIITGMVVEYQACHAWNRVTLQDGIYRYYDVTFYASTHDEFYLNTEENPHYQVRVNEYMTEDDLKLVS